MLSLLYLKSFTASHCSLGGSGVQDRKPDSNHSVDTELWTGSLIPLTYVLICKMGETKASRLWWGLNKLKYIKHSEQWLAPKSEWMGKREKERTSGKRRLFTTPGVINFLLFSLASPCTILFIHSYVVFYLVPQKCQAFQSLTAFHQVLPLLELLLPPITTIAPTPLKCLSVPQWSLPAPHHTPHPTRLDSPIIRSGSWNSWSCQDRQHFTLSM